ncbi:phosphopantetheine-binding protein [Shouchella lonarensis]|uniref:Acyl carrier protein n=1 Tax=Shouchella lonarensis TaxID=1464122 RepID=A0A1G6HE55_9BACI|nr:phosphopantetheine-binding protein [Shouchella lonarensis]SDB92542.1 acyl carrier protein [Shouchella lonarensis]
MKQTEVINLLNKVVKEEMGIQINGLLTEDTRLDEDLGIDSVLVLELLLHLEMTHAFVIPDDMMTPEDFRTIGTLTHFLCSCEREMDNKDD